MAFSKDKAFELLKNAHYQGRLAHALLITGADFSDLEELALRLVNLLNEKSGTTLDAVEGEFVHIVGPQSKTRRILIEQMRELERTVQVAAPENRWKIGIISEAERIAEQAANAFLKTLEEPPKRSLFLLLTTTPERLLPTIRSRCVRVSLSRSSKEREFSEPEMQLLQMLADNSTRNPSPIHALGFRANFSQLLASRKETLNRANELTLKEEEARFSKTTEADAWLKQRDEHFKALSETEYLHERSQFIDLIIEWFGDALHQQVGGSQLELPRWKENTEILAKRDSIGMLLRRIEALENLRSDLETNAQEQLALEVRFLQALA